MSECGLHGSRSIASDDFVNSTMEPDSKLKSVRAVHRGAVTKHFKKFDDNVSDFEEDNFLTLIDNLSVKRDILVSVNEKIIQQSTDEKIADEIADSDEYKILCLI